MAAPTITQIMEGIETRLETISGLRTAEYIPDAINPPQAVVDFPADIDYHHTFVHGKFSFAPTVTIIVSSVIDRTGTAALAAYASPTGANSIHLAIEGDSTLGGIVDYCTVVSFRRMTQEDVNGLGFYGGTFTLQVVAPGA